MFGFHFKKVVNKALFSLPRVKFVKPFKFIVYMYIKISGNNILSILKLFLCNGVLFPYMSKNITQAYLVRNIHHRIVLLNVKRRKR